MERIKTTSQTNQNNRIGFHYFPDTLHFREQDINTWLPHLKSLGATWVVLQAPSDRAIPEIFIDGLIRGNLEPLIHFAIPPETIKSPKDLDPLLYAYSRWGIKKVILFDRPNIRSSWSAEAWAKKNLIEQFIKFFLPLAQNAILHGITPIFPPLHPGGDYWDTVFLKSALEKLVELDSQVVAKLQFASYSWTWDKPLNWGLGGSSRWLKARPYSAPEHPDQRGFRNYEWVDQIVNDVLGKSKPIHLLGAGLDKPPEVSTDPAYFVGDFTRNTMNILKVLSGEKLLEEENVIGEIPSFVQSTNFWTLADDINSPYLHQAWFQSEENQLPIVKEFQNYIRQAKANRKPNPSEQSYRFETRKTNPFSSQGHIQVAEQEGVSEPGSNGFLTNELEKLRDKIKQSTFSIHPKISEPVERSSHSKKTNENLSKKIEQDKSQSEKIKRPIEHYLLLPTYEWGVSDWHLDVIRPFVKKHRATVGFSIREAVLAQKVTVVGNVQNFSEELLNKLRKAGCDVERINGDGTSIATQLRM